MPFPIQPLVGDDPAQFLIQDPFRLRKQILPILTIQKEGGFLTGLGTGFLVDPFGTFITAEHVLKDHFEDPAAREAAVAAVLYGMGLVFGTVGLRPECFAPIRNMFSWRRANPEPSPLVGTTPSERIAVDLLRFHVDASEVPGPQETLSPPIRLSGVRPQIGDRVMAIGYPELTCLRRDPPEKALCFIERMYGAVGTVTGLLPQGRGSMYPWPLIEVQAHWRSGMSGGPVFNETGEVIGLVSFSLEPDGEAPGVGYATDLASVGLSTLVPTINPSNSGWYMGWGVLRGVPWHLAGVFPDEAQADEFRDLNHPRYEVRYGSHRIGSDDFMSSTSGVADGGT